MSRSQIRTRSGKRIALHGKRDDRRAGHAYGTLLHENRTPICFRLFDLSYKVGTIATILSDARGATRKRARWITKKSLVLVRLGEASYRVRVHHRKKGNLVGIAETQL